MSVNNQAFHHCILWKRKQEKFVKTQQKNKIMEQESVQEKIIREIVVGNNLEELDNMASQDSEQVLTGLDQFEQFQTSLDKFGGARPKQYSNVIVDDSPLQNQMEKNKECKSKFYMTLLLLSNFC